MATVVSPGRRWFLQGGLRWAAGPARRPVGYGRVVGVEIATRDHPRRVREDAGSASADDPLAALRAAEQAVRPRPRRRHPRLPRWLVISRS